MQVYNIHDAKTHFSKLVDSVLQGEEIIIAKAGKPAAKLVPIKIKSKRRFGVLEGKITIARDFDTPLPNDVLDDFEN